MRLLVLSGFIGIGLLLTGCGMDISNAQIEKNVEAASMESNQQFQTDDESFGSVMYAEGLTEEDRAELGLKPTLYDFVAEAVESMDKPPSDERAGIDEGFDIYLKSQEMDGINFYRDNGEYEMDFINLFMLSSVIQHEQFVRTSHIDENGGATERIDLVKNWKPTSKKQKQAYEYMKQILHDLDIKLNHDGKGETYGVTYAFAGDKADEIKYFWSGLELK